MKKIILLLAIVLTAGSCVTQKKYDELKASETSYYKKARKCGQNLSAALTKNKELAADIKALLAEKNLAVKDTARLSKELKRVQYECALMNEHNHQLLEKLATSKSQEEVQAMISEIQGLQTQLLKREDAAFLLERELAAKKIELEEKQQELLLQQAELDRKQSELEIQQAEINLRQAKIEELSALISQKELKMKEIKDLVKNALIGFEGNGLEITTKNGRIYVSMDEKLLFQSGRWNIDTRGVTAINKLASALAQQEDIDILVEGHTDDIPYNGSGSITDNWDLSTKRATSIARIILKNKEIDPSRVIASGRAEYCPIATESNSEARKKNRRTEIILSPRLEELMKVFE